MTITQYRKRIEELKKERDDLSTSLEDLDGNESIWISNSSRRFSARSISDGLSTVFRNRIAEIDVLLAPMEEKLKTITKVVSSFLEE